MCDEVRDVFIIVGCLTRNFRAHSGVIDHDQLALMPCRVYVHMNLDVNMRKFALLVSEATGLRNA
jgi:hypothetical protein